MQAINIPGFRLDPLIEELMNQFLASCPRCTRCGLPAAPANRDEDGNIVCPRCYEKYVMSHFIFTLQYTDYSAIMDRDGLIYRG